MTTDAHIQVILSARGKVSQPGDYTLVDLSDGQGPRVEIWDVAKLGAVPTQTEIDAVTPAQLTAYDAAVKTARFTATSRQKDILTTCALIVRARGIAAWNGMTTQQKVAAAFAEADVWVNIREFVEVNS